MPASSITCICVTISLLMLSEACKPRLYSDATACIRLEPAIFGMFENNFLELLAIGDVAAIPAAAGRFSFAAHQQNFLASAKACRCWRCTAPTPCDARAFRQTDWRMCVISAATRCFERATARVNSHLPSPRPHAEHCFLYLPTSSRAELFWKRVPKPQWRIARDRGMMSARSLRNIASS